MKHLVFVYGTLLTNERNHYLIENAKLIDKGYIENFYMFNLGRYPGIQKGAGKVLGEVYEVDDETLAKLVTLKQKTAPSAFLPSELKSSYINISDRKNYLSPPTLGSEAARGS